MGDIMNKVALITGSSKGIGKAVAISLASSSYDIVINYNTDYEQAKEVSEIVNSYGVRSLLIKCDISNESEVNNMVSKIINEFGKIDVLVNNAGIAIDSTFDDKTIDNFKRILDVNLIGTFIVSKIVGKYMLDRKQGNIVLVASTNAIDTYYEESLDYDASKAGVISLAHNLANHYAPYIRVNTICPGWVNTDMNKELDKEFINKENNKILLHRFGNTEEIAKVVKFIISDDASYINDSIIRVDGGHKC